VPVAAEVIAIATEIMVTVAKVMVAARLIRTVSVAQGRQELCLIQ
jgi:hypothetical protein